MATTLTATAEPSNGWTRLEVSTDASGATWVTITRTVNSFTEYVRWARVAQLEPGTPKTLTVLDAEVPYDQAATYNLSVLNGSGTQVGTATDTETLTDDGRDRLVFLAGPGIVVPIEIVSFPEVATESRGGLFDIIGRRNRVATTDVRSGEAGVLTLSVEDGGQQLRNLMAEGSMAALRTPTSRGYGTPAVFSFGRVRTGRPSLAGDSLREVVCEITQVDAPAVSASTSTPISWAAVQAYAATWADVKAETGWPTWYKVKTVPTTGL